MERDIQTNLVRVLALASVLSLGSLSAANRLNDYRAAASQGMLGQPGMNMGDLFKRDDDVQGRVRTLIDMMKDEKLKKFIVDSEQIEKYRKDSLAAGKSKSEIEAEIANTLVGKVTTNDINLALGGLLTQIVKDAKGLNRGDVICRGMAGENWRAIADLKNDGPLEALGNVLIYKSAEAFGRRLTETVDITLGDAFDGLFYNTVGPVRDMLLSVWRTCRNAYTGRSGVPFSVRELKLWRKSIYDLLGELEKMSKNSSMMEARSRDKIMRNHNNPHEDDLEEAVEPTWLGQRESVNLQLAYWTDCIAKRKAYYDPNSDDGIVFYSQQIMDLLKDINDNIVRVTRSHRDLGSSGVQSALSMRKRTLDLYFYNLHALISPRLVGDKELSEGTTRSVRRRGQSFGGGFDDFDVSFAA